MKNKIIFLFFTLLFINLPVNSAASKETFEIGKRTFLLNGEPFVVKAAELHYARIPEPYWEHRILMCKALGMNTICLYVFWNFHEQKEGEFDFAGDKNVAKFCKLAQKHGMYIILRPGSIRMCGMGNGWIALVVAQEKRYESAFASSLFYGTYGNLYEGTWQAVGSSPVGQWWKYYHGTGRE